MSDSLEQTAIATDHLKQWTFLGSEAGEVTSKTSFDGPADRNYALKNKQVRKFLQHEKMGPGVINLGWTDDAEPATAKRVTRWFIARKNATGGPVRYGEAVALGYGITPSFICNAHRTVGVDLEWSKSPVFEWKVLGGNLGSEVQTGDWVALYNDRAKECLLFFDRTVGGDIGWPSSKTWGAQLEDRVREAVKNHANNAYDKLLGRK